MKPKGVAYVNLVMDDEAGGGSAGARPDQPDAARRFEGHPHDLEATMARRRHTTWCWSCAVPKRSSMTEERWALVLSIIAVLFSFITLVVATTKHDTPTSNAANEEARGLPSGYDDVALYTSASEKLVGALWLESFSSASAHGSSGESLVGHGLPAPEALCNCACFAESNFAYCQNTAKTTVGVSTYAYNGLAGQWEAHNLRYFKDDSPGAAAGRKGTTFVDHSVLPDGPGGRAFFDIAYEGDMAEAEEDASGQGRSVEVVRGYTSDGVQCEAAPLCNAQCAGVQMYEAWRAKCDVR